MYFLLLRLLPWISGLGMAVAMWVQWQNPLWYPGPFLAGSVLFLVAATLLLWKRVSLLGFVERVLPPTLLLTATALAALMADNSIHSLALSVTAVVTATISLEMIFYFLFDPKRYPVNALSHIALASVPLTAYGFAVGISGLLVFVRIPYWIPCVLFGVYGLIAYWLTEHPVANTASRNRWRILGAVVGVQVAIFLLVLPLDVWAQGLLAAFLFALPLRIRRYAFPPVPVVRMAIAEVTISIFLFSTLLLTARWA